MTIKEHSDKFRYLEWVPRVVAAAQAHVPRIQQSAISTEITDIASRAAERGDIVQVGDELLTAKGENAEAFVLNILAERTAEDGSCHMLVPKEVITITDDTWLSGSLTKQGERYNAIRAVFGKGKEGDALAKAAFEAEAALYQTKPGSTTPGIEPGTKPETEGASGGVGPRLAVSVEASANPWKRDQWRGTEEARQAKMQSIIKSSTKLADGLAKAAGRTISDQPLRAVKNSF
jgi:hypothetical protein